MAQARREPRISEMEVLPPAQSRRAATHAASNVSDAVFETLPARTNDRSAKRPSTDLQSEPSLPGLGLLKQNAGSQNPSGSVQAGVTPGFAAFTILSALAVFWLCGGHALLY